MKTTILTFVIALLAATPAFSATHASSTCSNPNRPATADELFYEVPTLASELGMSGTSVVKIDLNPYGDVTSQSLIASSGNSMLDDAALRSARLSRYTAEVRNCVHVAGTYLYRVEF